MNPSKRILPTPEELKSVFDYDPETGEFTWRVKAGGIKKGTRAGSDTNKGYRQITLKRKIYLAHRMAWVISYGAWPDQEIDHINGNPKDNRIANLRPATRLENSRNCAKRRDNLTGYKGVSMHHGVRRWKASIKSNGRNIYLGIFENITDAAEAYAEASRRIHGEFSRLE
jgi:hypothetical protein